MPFFFVFTVFAYNVCKLWTISKTRLCKSLNSKSVLGSELCNASFSKRDKMSRPAKIIKLMKGVKPTRMWIDGKSFYITKHDEKDSFNQRVHNCTEEYKSHYNISFSNDLYYTRFQLPGVYYEKLHKFPHFTIKELEEYTNTNINIPETNEEDSIVISSKDVENVIIARNQLHSVFSVIRESQNILQFISIPVVDDGIRAKFESFKKEVLQIKSVDGMHETIFQKPERLHLTVGVFSLLNDVERSEAIKALNECKDNVINPIVSKSGPLRITVSGLGCMNNNHNKVNVLYANAKICTGQDLLQSMVNSISKHFYEKASLQIATTTEPSEKLDPQSGPSSADVAIPGPSNIQRSTAIGLYITDDFAKPMKNSISLSIKNRKIRQLKALCKKRKNNQSFTKSDFTFCFKRM